MKQIGIVIAIALMCSATLGQEAKDLFSGKQKTDHTVSLDIVVNASPHVVYQLWTTEQGIKNFFAPASHVDARVGGEYTVLFSPINDPQGLSHGTKGARFLKLNPNKSIAFEWITFAGDAELGQSGPPVAPRSQRDVFPLPTWVEISLESRNGGKQTLIRFRHYGFKDGPLWDESFQWFSKTWPSVLTSLKNYCEDAKVAQQAR